MDAAAAMLWCGEDSFGAEGLILEVVSGSLRSEKKETGGAGVDRLVRKGPVTAGCGGTLGGRCDR